MTSPITTHVLDTHLGRPAQGIAVTLDKKSGDIWQLIAAGETNADGRIVDWLDGQPREQGVYRISFETDPYFAAQGLSCFYPKVSIEFRLKHVDEHYHVPLLISAHGMSTYRGS
jgi:5-hydroxyisourate hydrolase